MSQRRGFSAAKVYRLRRQGESFPAIAEELGCSVDEAEWAFEKSDRSRKVVNWKRLGWNRGVHRGGEIGVKWAEQQWWDKDKEPAPLWPGLEQAKREVDTSILYLASCNARWVKSVRYRDVSDGPSDCFWLIPNTVDPD